MSAPPYPVLLVTHAGYGEGLLRGAESVLGRPPGVTLLTNEGLGPEALEERIGEWVDAREGPAVILADLGFGSCCTAARRVTRGRDDVAIVAGVGLTMLLAALASREHADLAAFVHHLRARAAESVTVFLGGAPA